VEANVPERARIERQGEDDAAAAPVAAPAAAPVAALVAALVAAPVADPSFERQGLLVCACAVLCNLLSAAAFVAQPAALGLFFECFVGISAVFWAATACRAGVDAMELLVAAVRGEE